MRNFKKIFCIIFVLGILNIIFNSNVYADYYNYSSLGVHVNSSGTTYYMRCCDEGGHLCNRGSYYNEVYTGCAPSMDVITYYAHGNTYSNESLLSSYRNKEAEDVSPDPGLGTLLDNITCPQIINAGEAGYLGNISTQYYNRCTVSDPSVSVIPVGNRLQVNVPANYSQSSVTIKVYYKCTRSYCFFRYYTHSGTCDGDPQADGTLGHDEKVCQDLVALFPLSWTDEWYTTITIPIISTQIDIDKYIIKVRHPRYWWCRI